MTEILKAVVGTHGEHWEVRVYLGERCIGSTQYLHKPKRDDIKTALRIHSARLAPGA